MEMVWVVVVVAVGVAVALLVASVVMVVIEYSWCATSFVVDFTGGCPTSFLSPKNVRHNVLIARFSKQGQVLKQI